MSERDPELRGSITDLPMFFEACSMVAETIREKVGPKELDDCTCEICNGARNLWVPLFRMMTKAVIANKTPKGDDWGDDENIKKRMSCAVQAAARLTYQLACLYHVSDQIEDVVESARQRAKNMQDMVDDAKVDIAWMTSRAVSLEVAESDFLLAVAEMAMHPLLNVHVTDKPIEEVERTGDDIIIAVLPSE